MKKTRKRLFSLLVSLIMILTAIPAIPVSAADPMNIMEPPVSQNVTENSNVTFSVAIFGGVGPYNYQWQSAPGESGPWSNLTSGGSGYTGAVLTLTAVTTAISGTYYRCVITDSDTPPTVMESMAARLQVTGGTAQTAAPTASYNSGTTATSNVIGINAAVTLATTATVANNPRIFYTTGTTAADTPNPTMASREFDYTECIQAPSAPGTFCVKAIATSANAAQSNVATFLFTVTNDRERLSDIKSDPDFLAWKAGYFKGAIPASVSAKINAVIGRMTLTERARFTIGDGSSYGTGRVPGTAGQTIGMIDFGIPQTSLSDGPAGLRITTGSTTGTYQRTPTWWPNGSARSATWNRDLNYRMGDAWGAENYYFSSDVMLAPGINIHRSVLNGRNFEYYSEDPYLSGRTAANEIKGFQADKNVGMMVKHFAVNNQETNRSNKNTQVSTRALREIYLRNFEYAITEGEPWAVMDSYNQINSVSAAQNYGTNTTILRNEWGFKGFVSTDWGNGTGGYGNAGGIYEGFNNGAPIAANSASRVLSGNDTLQFAPNGSAEIVAAVASVDHPLTQAHVDQAVRRLLEFVVKSPSFNNKPLIFGDSDQEALAPNRALGVEIGEEAVILLKNNAVNGKPALPLSKDASGKVLSLGLAANSLVNGGGGSGTVNMTAADAAAVPQLNRAIENIVGAEKLIRTDATVTLTGLTTASNERVISPDLQAAWTNDTDLSAVIYTLKRTSSEGSDINAVTTSQAGNTGYNLHATETNIINVGSSIARAKNVPFVVVLNQGSWSNISSWIDKADAVVMGWNQGMAGGTPIARVLFGDVNPSGKTPTSVPVAVSGTAPNGAKYNPSEGQFGGSGAANPVYYVEDIYVGYRYFDTFNVPVSFPFGYGMSYTTYEYSDAVLGKNTFNGASDKLTASVKVTNTGKVAGKEIVQFYVGAPGVQMNKPVKELKGYGKTKLLQPGESETITVEFDAMALASYSNKGATNGQWLVEKGHYAVYFAASSQDIRATKSFVVGSDFVVKTVDANAAAPREAAQEYLDANAIRPDQITATFKPLPGAVEGASFQKAYSTMGASYGYLPELPEGYAWFIEGTSAKVYADTVVTDGDKTLEASLDPFVLEGDGKTVKATIYNAASADPLTFIVALYDETGRLVESRNSTAPASAYALGVSLTLQGYTAGRTIRAFLWDGGFVPCSKPAEWFANILAT